jgi:hypothetical protein
MKLRRLLVATIVLAGSSLAGCATTTPTIAQSKSVPSDRVLAFNSPDSGNVRLTIVRDKAFAGSAVAYQILIDGTVSAKLRAGEMATFYVGTGDRILEVRHPSSIVGAIGDSETIHAEAGNSYYFRINSDLGQIRLVRTTAESMGLK